jgi:hypothetical protein
MCKGHAMQYWQCRSRCAQLVGGFGRVQHPFVVKPHHGIQFAADQIEPFQRHRCRLHGRNFAFSDSIREGAEIKGCNRALHQRLSMPASHA